MCDEKSILQMDLTPPSIPKKEWDGICGVNEELLGPYQPERLNEKTPEKEKR